MTADLHTLLDTDPAAGLRGVAALMRKNAGLAEKGPWRFDPDAAWGTVRCDPHPGDDETRAIADALVDRDAVHIAAADPPFVLAVAAWLEAESAALSAIAVFSQAATTVEQAVTIRGAAMVVSQNERGGLSLSADTSIPAIATARAYLDPR